MSEQTKTKTRPWLVHLLTWLMLLAGGCALGLLSLYFSAGDHGLYLFAWYLTQPMVLVLNLIPFVLMLLLFYAAFGRAWLAYLTTGAVCLFFSWAQYWKLMARSDPIYAGDLLIVGEAAQMAGQYIQITWQIILSAILVLAAVIALLFLAKGRMKKPLPRLALAAAVLCAALWLYPNYYTSSSVYNSMTVWPKINQWFETNRYISRGGIYPFIHSIPDALPTPPEGYDEDAAREDLAAYPSDDIPADQKITLVVTQLEAFADLSTATDRITGVDPYAEYHAILAESYHGKLLPNIFAGGTIDTERCVLTGFSKLEEFRRVSWSYARYFADQGYIIEGAHAGYEAFYNRLNVNANLGLSDYRFVEGYYDSMVPDVPYDNVFLPDLTKNILEKMENGPVFSFNVTYQGHGPYSTEPSWRRMEFTDGRYSYATTNIINDYLASLYDTQQHLKAMLDQFAAEDRPVVIVGYGDHKPWFGDGNSAYKELGINIDVSTDEGFYNYYGTRYFIWANDAAKAVLGNDFVGEGPDISPNYLMNLLFDLCGWEGSAFTQATGDIMETLPVITTNGRYMQNGVLTAQPDEKGRALVKQYQNLEYYYRTHFAN